MVMAVKIGEETWTLKSGSQLTLPDSSAFPVPASLNYDQTFLNNGFNPSVSIDAALSGGNPSQPIFNTPNGYNIGDAASYAGDYIDPVLTTWNYVISDHGFMQYTGTGNLASLDTGTGAVYVNTSYNNGVILHSTISGDVQGYSGGAGDLTIVSLWETTVSVNSGINSGAITNVALGSFAPVALNSDIVFYANFLQTNGPLDYGVIYANSGASYADPGNSILISPDGVGGIVLNQISASITANLGVSMFDGRYRSVGLDLTNYPIIPVPDYIYCDWLPTVIGFADDFVFSTITFDDAQITADMIGGGIYWVCDGTYFYGLITYNNLNVPIQPYFVRVDIGFTQYTLIHTVNGDALVDAFIAGFLAGFFSYGITPGFSTVDNSIFLTGGPSSDMFYAITGLSSSSSSEFNKAEPIFALNCQNYCLPLHTN